ncbi:MAG: glycosyltransferase family 39 protein [Verrucomicrobiales bacterium]|nr:glycosyltransferase family 39 protein [Verrucomicrobiales bacterium]
MKKILRRHAPLAVMMATLSAAAFFLFWNLGHYSFWDDEPNTAMAAKGLVRHGDTVAWVGDGNLAARDSGLSLDDQLRERMTPPLASWLTAASFLAFGETLWSARLPHAALGLLTVALLLHWARQCGGTRRMVLVALLVIGNVSFWLYFRQCRYYALCNFFTLATAWSWWHWRGRRRDAATLTMALLGLMLSSPVTYVAMGVALATDWLLWRRRDFSWRQLFALAVPQVIGLLWLWWFWNPWSTGVKDQHFGPGAPENDFVDVLTLFYWHIRDLNRCEFYAALPVLAALALAWRARQTWIYRAVLAALLMMLMVAKFSTQFRAVTNVADVRFDSHLIPLLLLVEAGGIALLCRRRQWLALPLAALVAFTNLGNCGWWLPEGARSTTLQFARELLSPPAIDPFTPTAAWLRDHVPAGETVYVVPNVHAYPLMFSAPKPIYTWQFEPRFRAKEKFKNLDARLFKGGPPPDYLVAFGPRHLAVLSQEIKRYCSAPTHYELVAKVDVFWMDLFRPEMFWRTFKPVTGYDRDRDVVFIFKRRSVD